MTDRTLPHLRQKARPLRPGDLIGVVAPSGPVDREQLAKGVARLQSWGYRVLVGPSVLAGYGYLAGTDAQRAADFNTLWAAPDVAGIICARGGYGAMRILEQIDWDVLCGRPKFFCGFSDITALHLALEQRAGLVTFHGPMAAAFGAAVEFNGAGLLAAMRSSRPLGRVPWPSLADPALGQAPAPVGIRPGHAEGSLAGGNLSLICALLGTPWEPDFTDRILLLEDVDESPYRVDRMLTQLQLAGTLSGVAGILFGDSPSCMHGAPERPSLTLMEVLADRLVPLGVPVLYGFPFGHTPWRATLPLGVRARLDAESGVLEILEAALADRI